MQIRTRPHGIPKMCTRYNECRNCSLFSPHSLPPRLGTGGHSQSHSYDLSPHWRDFICKIDTNASADKKHPKGQKDILGKEQYRSTAWKGQSLRLPGIAHKSVSSFKEDELVFTFSVVFLAGVMLYIITHGSSNLLMNFHSTYFLHHSSDLFQGFLKQLFSTSP